MREPNLGPGVTAAMAIPELPPVVRRRRVQDRRVDDHRLREFAASHGDDA